MAGVYTRGPLRRLLAAAPKPVSFQLDESRPQYPPRPLKVPKAYLRERAPDPAPTISLVTPVLDQAAFVGSAIESALGQGYPALEYVVMDGDSGDGSVEIAASRLGGLAHFESAPDRGQASAINRGFERTGGELMGWLNSDDLLLPGTLAHVARRFAEHPDLDMVYGNRVLIDESGREVGLWATPAHGPDSLDWFDFVPQETAFWRRRIWDQAGGIDESFPVAFDWDLFLRFQRAGARIERLPRFLGCFRLHAAQRTRMSQPQALRELQRIREAHHGRPVTLDEARARIDRFRMRALPHHARQRARRALGAPFAVEPGMIGEEGAWQERKGELVWERSTSP